MGLRLPAVVFPQDLLINGLAADNFAMLGLGDIVIPGIFIALLLRFDVRSVSPSVISSSRCSAFYVLCSLLIIVHVPRQVLTNITLLIAVLELKNVLYESAMDFVL